LGRNKLDDILSDDGQVESRWIVVRWVDHDLDGTFWTRVDDTPYIEVVSPVCVAIPLFEEDDVLAWQLAWGGTSRSTCVGR
jgi:hypothetical protein